MRFLVTEFNELWACRYLREAIAECQEAEMCRRDGELMDHASTSIRRAQLSIFFALGSPEYLDLLAATLSRNVVAVQDDKLRFIANISQVAQHASDRTVQWSRGLLLSVAKEMVAAASSILKELTEGRCSYLLEE